MVLDDYGHVNRLAVSPDARLLAVAGNPHVRFYDMQSSGTAQPTCRYDGHKSNVGAMGFDANGNWLYTGSEDGTMRVWDTRSQKCQRCFENNGLFDRIALHSVDLHPNQVELLAGDQAGRVHVWDLAADRIRQQLVPEEGVPVRSVCVASDAKSVVRVVCANHEGTCYVWQLSDDSYNPLQKIDAHSAYVLACRFSPEAKHLATTSADNTINLWQLHSEGFARCFTLTGHSKWVWDCAFSRDGQYLVTGSSDCTCRLWDVRTGTQRSEFSGFKRGVTAIALVDAASR